jgi:hypothetical protein
MEEGIPGGYVYLDGDFLAQNSDDVKRLIRVEAEQGIDESPLSLILRLDAADQDRLTIETTTEYLAHRLGSALERAYGGEVHYGFSHQNGPARVWWHHD